MAKYFGTNGVRGKFDLLNPELALKVAQAVGVFFNRGKILVAHDVRLTGPALKHAVIAGLESVGCKVIELGMVSSPTAEFMIKKLKADGAVIITASHNPPEWNALKVTDGNCIAISKERGEQIEALMERPRLAQWYDVKPEKNYKNGIADHIAAIKKFVDEKRIRKARHRLVLDCANNTPALIAPTLFRELGCEIITLNSHLDGHFPGRPSEPTEANVKDLIETVKATGADCGIAWDGDGDRVIFVDEKGSYVIGDRVFALSVLLKLREKKGDVVTTVATSRAAEDTAKKFGCKTYYTKIGAPYLSEAVLKKKAVIGGEEVGGVIWPELSPAKDGFMTAAKIVEGMTERRLSEWLKEIPIYYNEKAMIECDEKRKKRIVEGMRGHAIKNKLRFIDVDGVRIDFDDSWVIVRPSGTEPCVRVFAEARKPEKAKRLLNEYVGIAEKF